MSKQHGNVIMTPHQLDILANEIQQSFMQQGGWKACRYLLGKMAREHQVEVERLRADLDDVSETLQSHQTSGHYEAGRLLAEKVWQAELERLRMRLREQTVQIAETAEQIHAKVVETIMAKMTPPEDLDLHGHPIEQVVGTCLTALVGEIERLQLDCAAMRDCLGVELFWEGFRVDMLEFDIQGTNGSAVNARKLQEYLRVDKPGEALLKELEELREVGGDDEKT